MTKRINLNHPDIDFSKLELITDRELFVLKDHNWEDFPLGKATIKKDDNGYFAEVTDIDHNNPVNKLLLNQCLNFEIGGQVLEREGNLITKFKVMEVSICH